MAECPHPDVWQPPPRCTSCGHRVPVGGRQPIGSRRLVRTWPYELAARIVARLMRGQPDRVRTGLEQQEVGGAGSG